VEFFLRALTMEVMSGQSDGIYNANNYWLYFNPDVNKFQYFRHDFDLSFGTFENWMRMVDDDIYTWGFKARGRILLTRILSAPSFRATYSDYLRKYMRAYFNPLSSLIPRLDQIGRMVAPALGRVRQAPSANRHRPTAILAIAYALAPYRTATHYRTNGTHWIMHGASSSSSKTTARPSTARRSRRRFRRTRPWDCCRSWSSESKPRGRSSIPNSLRRIQ